MIAYIDCRYVLEIDEFKYGIHVVEEHEMTSKDPKRQKLAGDPQGEEAASSQSNIKGLFKKELTPMMYGFGDDETPMDETVDLVADIIVEYSSGVMIKALDIAAHRGKIKAGGKPAGPPTADDILTVVSNDPKKVMRLKELLIMQQEIKLTTERLEKDEEALAKLIE